MVSKALEDVLQVLKNYSYEEVVFLSAVDSDAQPKFDFKENTIIVQEKNLLQLFQEATAVCSRFVSYLKKRRFEEAYFNPQLVDYLLRFLLLVYPDQPHLWNIRKQLILEEFLSLNVEFNFHYTALKKDSRSSCCWYHRKWLIAERHKKECIETAIPKWLNEELELCCLLARRFPKVYFIWSYRSWLIHKYISSLTVEWCEHEYERSKNFIKCHPSDYGAYFYRQQFLLLYLKRNVSSCNSIQVMRTEWNLMKQQQHILNEHWRFYSIGYHIIFLCACCYRLYHLHSSECLQEKCPWKQVFNSLRKEMETSLENFLNEQHLEWNSLITKVACRLDIGKDSCTGHEV